MTNASAPVVNVRRVACGTAYTRVSSIRAEGERSFVLVAGIGVAATYFERLAPQLNEFGAVHALDLPGFGGVPHPESAMSIAQYADAVEAVLDELALEDPVLVGHSMGTQIVSEVARRRPEISALVLIGPVVDPEARRLPRLALRFLRSTWHEPFKVKLLAVGAYLLCGPRWFLRVLPEMMRFPIEELFADIRAHTLVIRGEYDAVVPRAWVERAAREIPFASTWEIGGAAHSVMHGHAEGVARLCVAFARTPRDTDGELHLMSDAEAETPEPRATSLSAALRAFLARFVEFIGVLRRDDRKVARGKTAHARVMKKEQG